MKTFIAAFVGFMIFCTSLAVMEPPRTARQSAQVVAVENDVIEVQLSDGRTYSFYGNGFAIGDTITVTVRDGMIIDARQ